MDIDDRLLEIMLSHEGTGNAVRMADLADRLGVNTRTVQSSIARLIDTRGAMIGSHPALGYFMIRDREDMNWAKRGLISRASKIYQRLQKLERCTAGEFAQQLEMFAGQGPEQ